MNLERALTCEITPSDPIAVTCQFPEASWIDVVAGLGSALGTLVAAAAAVFGVYEAFKQRARADRLEKKDTLRTIGERYFEAMNALADSTAEGRFRAGGAVHRSLFDLTNILNDGDSYQKRLAEALSVVTGPIVDDVMSALRPVKDGSTLDEIRSQVNINSARSLAETVAEQAQSAFNVVIHVESAETKEERIAFFERRATSLASTIPARREREKGKK